MKTVIVIILGVFVWCNAAFAAADAPMVEKHIFLPEKPAEKKQVVSDDKLEKSILFTGVVVSDKGKFALITERVAKKPGEFRKKIYQEGETVAGAVIASISPNQLVLTNAGNDVKIKLYRADKQRPKPVAVQPSVHVTSETPAAADAPQDSAKKAPEKAQSDTKVSQSPSQLLDNKIRQSEAAKGNVLDKKSNPFAEALKKAIQNKQAAPSGGGSTGTTSNPFLEAIKRAQEKQ